MQRMSRGLRMYANDPFSAKVCCRAMVWTSLFSGHPRRSEEQMFPGLQFNLRSLQVNAALNSSGAPLVYSLILESQHASVAQSVSDAFESSVAFRSRNRCSAKLLPVWDAPTTAPPLPQKKAEKGELLMLFEPTMPQLNAVDVIVLAVRLA